MASIQLSLFGFRPLAGINCNLFHYVNPTQITWFPSPCGDKLKSVTTSAFVGLICFRPLMEDNFTIPHIEPKEKNHPQEKHGWSRKDKP